MGDLASSGPGPLPGIRMSRLGPRSTLRVAALQRRPGGGAGAVPLERLAAAAVDVVVLPEYFWVRPEDRDVRDTAAHADRDLEELSRLSEALPGVLVGGTIVETGLSGRLFNTAPVFHEGREIGRYRKRRLMPGEAAAGLGAGDTIPVFEAGGIRLGVLVCADVFDETAYAGLRALRPDVIAVPTNSPFRPNDTLEEKLARDEAYFATGARVADAVVVKACTVGGIFGRPAQGRSLVADPGGVVARVSPEGEHLETHLIVEFPAGKLL